MLDRRSNEEYERVMDSVLEDMKNLNSLSNGLLLLAQTGLDGTERRMVPLRIDDLVWQTREELIDRHPDYKIRIDLDDGLDDDLSLTIEGDEQLIRVALSNVIENGCKYGQDGPVDILIKPSRRGLALFFSDRGIGIPPKDLPNVFEPFYRAANTQNIKGHGIGLSMVKRIINLHHGTIRITSKLGDGTTVTVDLPTVKTPRSKEL
jgi:signal transduction histidine kinase